MRGLCNLPLDLILWSAFAFIAVSIVLGVISAIKALTSPPPPTPAQAAGVVAGQQIGPILEALKGLIEALGKAPAWFALFLAGLFLFWLAGEVYVEACKPATAVTKSTRTTDDKTTTTTTEPGKVSVSEERTQTNMSI